MKRFLNLFVLIPAEQRVVIVLVLLLVLSAWFKHNHDSKNTLTPLPAPEATMSTPPK